MLRLGISLQPRWPLDDGTAVLRAASHAEDLDFDHAALGNRLLDSGFGLDADPLVLLAAVSAATTRLRLLTSVLVAPYYPALVLANQAATLDVVSGGRLILGVGTGWNPQEFDAVGVPARERGVSATEVTGVRRRLRELDHGTGNAGRLTLASAVFLTPPGIAAAVPAPGRPLGGAVPTVTSVVDDLGRLAEAGLTACTAWLPIAAEHVEKAMEWIAAEVIPQLT